MRAIKEYIAVVRPEQTPRAMPVEQTELPAQHSAQEVSLRAMAEVVTQQTMILQQVLEKTERKPARQQQGCFKCEGSQMQRDCAQRQLKQQSTSTNTKTAEN